MTGRPPRLAAALIVALVAFCAGLVQLSLAKSIAPHDDELEYLGYGRTLAETGRYATTPAGPAADHGPGREPLYPVLVAAVMRLDPVLGAGAARCIGNTTEPACPAVFGSLRWTNALLVALAAALVFLSAHVCFGALAPLPPAEAGSRDHSGRDALRRDIRASVTGGAVAAWGAGLYVALNLQMMKEIRYVISDYLALALAAAVVFALASALQRPRSVLRWIALGGALGLLVLTKALFEIYAVLLLAGLVVWLLLRRNRAAVRAVVAVGLMLAVLVGGWSARNWATFGRFALTDSRGGVALSTREIFDHMTAGEYAVSFFWWTRGPGPGMARALFDQRDWHRHEWEPEDGFYNQGQVVRYEARVRRLMDERGLDRASADAATPGVILGEIAGRFPMYVATMIPLTYRGLWFDEFIVLGFPAFVWLVVRSARRHDWTWLLVLSPAAFSLLAYPAVSLNIARYQIPAAPGLALAAGMAIAALVERWRGATALAIRFPRR